MNRRDQAKFRSGRGQSHSYQMSLLCPGKGKSPVVQGSISRRMWTNSTVALMQARGSSIQAIDLLSKGLETNKMTDSWVTTRQNSTRTESINNRTSRQGPGITVLSHLQDLFLYLIKSRTPSPSVSNFHQSVIIAGKMTLDQCTRIGWGRCRGPRRTSETTITILTHSTNHQLQSRNWRIKMQTWVSRLVSCQSWWWMKWASRAKIAEVSNQLKSNGIWFSLIDRSSPLK